MELDRNKSRLKIEHEDGEFGVKNASEFVFDKNWVGSEIPTLVTQFGYFLLSVGYPKEAVDKYLNTEVFNLDG